MSVNSYLTNLANSSIIRDTEKISINKSIESFESKLKIVDSYFSNHFIFGSHSRGTILPRAIDENSDIDYMIVFNDNSKKPQSYLNFLRDKVASKYSRSEIYQSSPTIVLELNHIKFELVPAIKNNWGQLQIPAKASDSNDWIVTDPTGFNATLTSVNQSHNNLIKPLVRLVKYWNVKAGYPFESFSLEQKVVNSIFYANIQLKDYFYNFVSSLTIDYFMAQWKKDAVAKFKRIVSEASYSERIGMAMDAETKIKKLFE
jgi:predicted nucleotidyltransferase